MDNLVKPVGGDPWNHMGADLQENLGRRTAGPPHAFDLVRGSNVGR